MKALTQSRFGGPEVLELVDLPRPRLRPTEVLVRVFATSVNPVETHVRAGDFPLLGEPPFVLGWDVSGVVEEAAPGSARFQVGDEVFGLPLFPRQAAAHAEYVASPTRQLVRKPANLSHAQAAALPLCGLTALQALDDIARVRPGQRVLVHAAGGGVGHLAVQIAQLLGAEVIATASAGKHDFLRSLGVAQVVDYRNVDFTTVVRDVDVVFDLVGPDCAKRSLDVLRPGGLVVSGVLRGSEELPTLAAAAGKRFSGVAVEPDRGGLERLAAWAEAGRLVPHVAEVLPLRDGARAHARVAEGRLQGKLALAVA